MEKIIDDVYVTKVGTNVLVNQNEDGSQSLNRSVLRSVGRQATVESNNVIVSSAAIAAGMIETGTMVRPDKRAKMPELQRLSSIGQRHILNAWGESIHHEDVGEVLLTRHTLDHNRAERHAEEERAEALKVIYTLLRHGEVPVVNENDAVTHDEISFGDNDILAATLAACMARSSLFGNVRLLLLSDVNGVYADKDDPGTRIPIIENTADYRDLAQESDSDNGTGGMVSKFDAADIAQAAGVDMWIFDPRNNAHRNQAMRGKIGTYFPARSVEQ